MFVKQLNLNKCKLAHLNLCQMLQNEKPSIFCIQEPYYTKNGTLSGIPKNYKWFGNKSSRGIILYHVSIYLLMSSHMMTFQYVT